MMYQHNIGPEHKEHQPSELYPAAVRHRRHGCLSSLPEGGTGGDYISDVSLLKDEATQRLRGSHALPSHTTLYRFLAGADLGRVAKAMAVNRDMLRRAWAMEAAPQPGILIIDPDATYIDTY